MISSFFSQSFLVWIFFIFFLCPTCASCPLFDGRPPSDISHYDQSCPRCDLAACTEWGNGERGVQERKTFMPLLSITVWQKWRIGKFKCKTNSAQSWLEEQPDQRPTGSRYMWMSRNNRPSWRGGRGDDIGGYLHWKHLVMTFIHILSFIIWPPTCFYSLFHTVKFAMLIAMYF